MFQYQSNCSGSWEILSGRKTKIGMTLVETLMGIVVSCLLLTVVFKFYGNTLSQFRHGFVNLQNFQDAHIAISWLRRDFTTATPFLFSKEGKDGQALRETLRLPVDLRGERNLGKNQKIQISDNMIIFHRFVERSFSQASQIEVEEISYRFDPTQKSLIRKSNSGEKSFKGFREVLFKCYIFNSNSEVPLLYVKFVLDHGETPEGGKAGTPLELCTTISSAFITDSTNSKFWNCMVDHYQAKE